MSLYCQVAALFIRTLNTNSCVQEKNNEMTFALLHAHEYNGTENKIPRLPREENISPKQIFYWSDITSISVDVGWADARKSYFDYT